MSLPQQSPYRVVLGDAAFAEAGGLHPRLRAYFSAIPDGHYGKGVGVFDAVGTPRRWLRPLIRLLVDADVLFAVWAHDVSFEVRNSPTILDGCVAVAGERTFHLPGGDRVMRDLVVASPDGLVDVLGRRGRFRAEFTASVVDGSLHLNSHRVIVRLGPTEFRVPRCVAPRVELIERFSDADDRQHVAVAVFVPIVGTVYEYSGSFDYQIEERAP